MLGYADLVFAYLYPNAMRNMLRICDEFASDFSVIFNDAKSKCLLCLSYNSHRSLMCYRSSDLVFYVGNNAIEIVDNWPHLGHIIANNCDDELDIVSRKFNLIGQNNNIVFHLKILIVSQSIN